MDGKEKLHRETGVLSVFFPDAFECLAGIIWWKHCYEACSKFHGWNPTSQQLELSPSRAKYRSELVCCSITEWKVLNKYKLSCVQASANLCQCRPSSPRTRHPSGNFSSLSACIENKHAHEHTKRSPKNKSAAGEILYLNDLIAASA